MPEETKRSQTKPIRAAVACLIVAAFVWILFGGYNVFVVAHYTNDLKSIHARMAERGPADREYETLVSRCNDCRIKLVALGHFVRRDFRLERIQGDTRDREVRLFRALASEAFPDSKEVEMITSHVQFRLVPVLIVWDRPKRMAAWEEFVRTYDVKDFWKRFGKPK